MKKSTVLPDGDGNYSSPELDCQRLKRAEGNEGEGKLFCKTITDRQELSNPLRKVTDYTYMFLGLSVFTYRKIEAITL